MNLIVSDHVAALREVAANAPLEPWLAALDADEIDLVKRLLLARGSVNEVAADYGVSYQAVRQRLDRMIAKVRVAEDAKPADPFERRLRALVAGGEMSPSLAKTVPLAHRASVLASQRG
jgi:hypothetical protein